MREKIVVSEIFGPVVQGEGALIGRPTLFVRTGGCDFRCAWCDTLYAVLPEYRADWTPMSAETIVARLNELCGGKPMLVTLSGGNPALQPLQPLLESGHAAGYHFALETQGSVAREWFADLDYLVLSPKPPSSGMVMNWQRLDDCIQAAQSANPPQSSLKIVVFDEEDYQFSRQVGARYPATSVYLQVGNPAPESSAETETPLLLEKLRWLCERVLCDGWHNAIVLHSFTF